MRTRPEHEFQILIGELREFIASEVVPQEHLLQAGDAKALQETTRALQRKAMARGFGAARTAREYGGLALSWEECCSYLEEAGRSFLGPAVLQCAPPTQPDIYALEKLGSPEQQQRYLEPLRTGDLHSCFAMTEPTPGVGSDPRMLSATAKRLPEGDWEINAHKWFITGAVRADVAIVVARTEGGVSWFLVDTDTPGYRLVRDVPTMEPFDAGGHGEITLTNCRVPASALIGEEGRGLEYAQLRLEGARLFHCMRFIGMASRAMDIAQEYASHRESYGVKLGEHQMVQSMIADAHIELYAARLMTRDVARMLDAGESIRHHSSMAKVFVSEVVCKVADSAVQICGALGISEDTPVSMIYRQMRPFRIYDGASEVHRSAIAKRALRHRICA
ncbi:acyl-CoA dehydrogenase [Comamonas testosteroni]|uniref:Acyl-CoA dehydrogenase n=1 Tax=Comamonas testosteroni TaxID=285 RepID=A0A0L7MR29_COMTE|nr:acyl-CoA dehydrogenase family protein [Comamonas testosteroni]KOC24399.1 acyl-CoA dehydrogenase [Comamonas testosteroni]KWT67568.1 Butyryl-CoA dehydrogenase [Comamonas testosteroni]